MPLTHDYHNDDLSVEDRRHEVVRLFATAFVRQLRRVRSVQMLAKSVSQTPSRERRLTNRREASKSVKAA